MVETQKTDAAGNMRKITFHDACPSLAFSDRPSSEDQFATIPEASIVTNVNLAQSRLNQIILIATSFFEYWYASYSDRFLTTLQLWLQAPRTETLVSD